MEISKNVLIGVLFLVVAYFLLVPTITDYGLVLFFDDTSLFLWYANHVWCIVYPDRFGLPLYHRYNENC